MKMLIRACRYGWLLCVLILLLRDGCDARFPAGLQIDRKDLSVTSHDRVSHHHHHPKPEVENALPIQNSKTENETTIITADSINGVADLQKEDNGDGEESLQIERELVEHIDYAGATTHPPIEPPKKNRPKANKGKPVISSTRS